MRNTVKEFEILTVKKGDVIIPFNDLSPKEQADRLSTEKSRLPGESVYEIHSIKRKKTNEVFTVGDAVKFDDNNRIIGNIDCIWISYTQMRIDIGNCGFVLYDFIVKA